MRDLADPRASFPCCSAPMARVERKGGRVASEGKELSLTFKTGTPSLRGWGMRREGKERTRRREKRRERSGWG